MRGEISKRPFGEEIEKKHFESIHMQMGRVQLDSDWNEAFETTLKARGRAYADIIGRHGSPNDGFRVEHDLIVDHLDNKDGWVFAGTGQFRVDHLEKMEGLGSFKIIGQGEVKRNIPSLLTNLATLRQALVDRGAPSPDNPRLTLFFKIDSTEDKVVELALEKNGGGDAISSGAGVTYPCNGWLSLELELDMVTKDLTEYTALVIRTENSGSVHFDRLALKPGFGADDDLNDFYIQGGDGTVDRAGRYYVDGLACVKEGFDTYHLQQDYPEAPLLDLTAGGDRVVYLDAWKRTVTHVEDPDILETALDGPDTCTREQLVSQVKVIEAPACASDIEALKRPDPTGRLSAMLSPESEQDKCDFRPELDYTGLRNSLYRIEIHTPGDKEAAVFKWSRNNGADLVGIDSFDPDGKSVMISHDRVLCRGDWVELSDDVSDLADAADTGKHGLLAKITHMEHQTDGIKITLEDEGGLFSTADFSGRSGCHPKLRKWHGVEKVTDFDTFDGSGVPEKELEHGIRLGFSDDYFYHGDYWQFTARTNDRSIEELDQALPMGPEHHYAPLALITEDPVGGGFSVFDTCRLVFPPLTALRADHISFDPDACEQMKDKGIDTVQEALEHACLHHGCHDIVVLPGESIQDAVDRLKETGGGSIWLAPGVHMVQETIELDACRDIAIQGDGAATRVVYLPVKPDEDSEEIQNLEEDITSIDARISDALGDGDDELVRTLREERLKLYFALYRALGDGPDLTGLRIRVLEIEDDMTGLDPDSEEYKELEQEREEVQEQIEKYLFDHPRDMFRISNSQYITLGRFLMFAPDARSLVSIVKKSLAVKINDCDLVNHDWDFETSYKLAGFGKWPFRGKRKPKGVFDEVDKPDAAGKKAFRSCIRFTGGCRFQIESSRMAGPIGIHQHGEYEAEQLPVIDEFTCVENRIAMDCAGLVLLNIKHSNITSNLIYNLHTGIPDEEMEVLKELLVEWVELYGTCQTRDDALLDEFIDRFRDLIFGCTPEDMTLNADGESGLLALAMLDTRLVNNRIWAGVGIHLVYSRANIFKQNQILTTVNALTLLYNFRTRIMANVLDATGNIDWLMDRENPGASEVRETRGTGGNIPNRRTFFSKSDLWASFTQAIRDSEFAPGHTPAVRVHFSDRQMLVKNQIKGGIGWISDSAGEKEFFGIMEAYAELWGTSNFGEAMVALIRRFVEVMGLTPAFNLFETLMSIFTGGVEIDWIAYLVEQHSEEGVFKRQIDMWESTGFLGVSVTFDENPFVAALAGFFRTLINLQVMCRSKLIHNRFDVMRLETSKDPDDEKFVYAPGHAGIVMRKGITLGGVRISRNRITGAEHTGVLWDALDLMNNPEMTGLLLQFSFDILVYALIGLRDFLNVLIDIFEGKDDEDDGDDSVSFIFILFALFVLYGIGTICPNMDTGTGEEPDDPEAEPENPFLVFMKELVAALDGFIGQLTNGKVEHTVKDLMSHDDRIQANQVKGKGNGVHTNVANIMIKDNRIDVSPGISAIPELFAMGHFMARNSLVHTDTDPTTGETVDHSAVAYLGFALMNLNPDMVRNAAGMFDAAPEQWNNLDPVLEQLDLIASEASTAQKLRETIQKIKAHNNSAGDTGALGDAVEEFIEEILKHLNGYGMILEAPGMRVHGNLIEAVQESNLGGTNAQSPGGILMTCGSGFQNMIPYFIGMEEGFPLINMGGQGTEFTGNSLQWGAGHGLSFSNLPLLWDLRIENNEVQNFGQSGIFCEQSIFTSVIQDRIRSYMDNDTSDKDTLSMNSLLSMIAMPFAGFPAMYRVRVVENEINNCLKNTVKGISSNVDDHLIILLAGVLFKDVTEMEFLENSVRACGLRALFERKNDNENETEQRWPGFGTVLIRCGDVGFGSNKIYQNGQMPDSAGDLTTESFYPRGGSLFFGNAGILSISDNQFHQNSGMSLLVIPSYTASLNATAETVFRRTAWAAYRTGFEKFLANILIHGNVFHIEDEHIYTYAKVDVGAGNAANNKSIQDLTFSQNQVKFPMISELDEWPGLHLVSEKLAFNGNTVTGSGDMKTVKLLSSKGLGVGNLLDHEPEHAVGIQIKPENNLW